MAGARLALALACSPAVAAESTFGVPNRFRDEIFQFRTLDAERVIVMENGFPVRGIAGR